MVYVQTSDSIQSVMESVWEAVTQEEGMDNKTISLVRRKWDLTRESSKGTEGDAGLEGTFILLRWGVHNGWSLGISSSALFFIH